MKLFTLSSYIKFVLKKKYDIEVAYLEGPTTRIIAGSPNDTTKLVSWIHGEQRNERNAISSYRGKQETISCYRRMDRIITVSEAVKQDFINIFHENTRRIQVIYNTNESEEIKKKAK